MWSKECKENGLHNNNKKRIEVKLEMQGKWPTPQQKTD